MIRFFRIIRILLICLIKFKFPVIESGNVIFEDLIFTYKLISVSDTNIEKNFKNILLPEYKILIHRFPSIFADWSTYFKLYTKDSINKNICFLKFKLQELSEYKITNRNSIINNILNEK